MKRTLLSFSLLLATMAGHAQDTAVSYNQEDLTALEAFVKSYPDYDYMVNYWDDMMYYEDAKPADKFGVKWTEIDGQKRLTKFQLNNTIIDEKAIETVDLNHFSALKEISLKSSGVRFIYAGSLSSLNSIETSKNDIETLDLPATIGSISIYESTTFTNGDFSKYTTLTGLYLMQLPISEVKISSPELSYLTLQGMPVKYVDLSVAKSKLNWVSISDCPLEGMWFDGYENLQNLTLENCGLTSVPLANLRQPLTLSISKNKIEHLDLSQLPLVTTISALNSGVKQVTFAPDSEALSMVNLSDNQIERLDISGWNYQPNSGTLRALNNPMTEFITNPNLKSLYLTNCLLASLDLSTHEYLGALDCKNNQLTFTTVKMPKYNSRFGLSPQDSIEIAKKEGTVKYLNPGDEVDLSAFVSPEDGVTGYQWYVLSGQKFVVTNEIKAGQEAGKFTMPEGIPGTYYCKLTTTSPLIKHMYLVTERFELTSPTGLTNTVSTVNIYPNPIEDHLMISGCENETIEIYNAAGMLVYRNQAIQNEIQVNAAAWAKGIYIVKVGTETHKMNKK
ncbi:MAG: T9SS type A sorting domain-containing protein [Bacteroidales bacterium]